MSGKPKRHRYRFAPSKQHRRRPSRKTLYIERLEPRRLLNVDWRNPVDSVDVDANGVVLPADALRVLSDLRTNGIRLLPDVRPTGSPYLDVTGDQRTSPQDALRVLSHMRTEGFGQRTLSEGISIADESVVTITLGQPEGSRHYRVELNASFDTTDQAATIEDVLAVHLVDAQQQTILDRGTPGTALFTLAGTKAEFIPGRVRWDGTVLEIDLSDLADHDTGLLKFQLLGSDNDQQSAVVIKPLSNSVNPAGQPSAILAASDTAVAPGAALELESLVPASGQVHVGNVRFDTATNIYAADVRFESSSSAVGRNVAIVFPNLPAGITLRNASGTDANGNSYVNLRSFTSFAQAAEEASLSRIYGGIHFEFDSHAGLDVGRAIGEYVLGIFVGESANGTFEM